MSDSARDIPGRFGGLLSIDLDALVANYRLLKSRGGPGGIACAAAVKADAYGLGLAPVARALNGAGCTDFWVATLDEGIALRQVLDSAHIHVLFGVTPDSAADTLAANLIPVLNSLDQVEIWNHHAGHLGRPLPCDLHVDTGMNRLGLTMVEAELLADSSRLEGLDVHCVISHLACADIMGHPLNDEQLNRFRRARRLLPMGRASLANSSGIFLGPDYHFDLLRPGAALYGINPRPELPNPMSQVVRLQGRVLQIRQGEPGQSVGYGATHEIGEPTRIAIVGAGYADGIHRALSGRGKAFLGDAPLNYLGRVSMDVIALDVSGIDPQLCRPGTLVDLIGSHNPPDLVAAAAGTIGYEVLTALGGRYHRQYVGDAAP